MATKRNKAFTIALLIGVILGILALSAYTLNGAAAFEAEQTAQAISPTPNSPPNEGHTLATATPIPGISAQDVMATSIDLCQEYSVPASAIIALDTQLHISDIARKESIEAVASWGLDPIQIPNPNLPRMIIAAGAFMEINCRILSLFTSSQ